MNGRGLRIPTRPVLGYNEEYAIGWYSGSFAFQIVTIFVGGKEVLEKIKSYRKFAQLTAGIATKMDDISRVLKVSGRFGISERIGLMLMDESASASLQLPLDFFFRLKSGAQMVIAKKRIIKLVDTTYDGTWSPGTSGNAAKNLDKHFIDHGKQFGLSGDLADISGKQLYVDIAKNMLEKRDNFEIYYQPGKQNMAIYDRVNNNFVIGNVDGEIQTLFKPDPGYIDDLVDEGRAIKIKG